MTGGTVPLHSLATAADSRGHDRRNGAAAQCSHVGPPQLAVEGMIGETVPLHSIVK